MSASGAGGRNVLVVGMDVEVARAAAPHLDPADTVKVVVPVVGQGFMDWLANDEEAFARADRVAGEVAEELPGNPVDARPGESDIALAIRDALATFAADEIVVAVDAEGRVVDAVDADQGAFGASVDGIPVRVVRTS